MFKINKKTLWDDFCRVQDIIRDGVLLFETIGLNVVNIPYGKNRRLILKRSNKMENLVIKEVNKVIADFTGQSNVYEGLKYMMFLKKGEEVDPLYIGKSEKYGKRQNLSQNIKNIERNCGKFCRWGYNYAYHVGDLSAVACERHAATKKISKYSK